MGVGNLSANTYTVLIERQGWNVNVGNLSNYV